MKPTVFLNGVMTLDRIIYNSEKFDVTFDNNCFDGNSHSRSSARHFKILELICSNNIQANNIQNTPIFPFLTIQNWINHNQNITNQAKLFVTGFDRENLRLDVISTQNNDKVRVLVDTLQNLEVLRWSTVLREKMSRK